LKYGGEVTMKKGKCGECGGTKFHVYAAPEGSKHFIRVKCCKCKHRTALFMQQEPATDYNWGEGGLVLKGF
jgi:hypothetical protein